MPAPTVPENKYSIIADNHSTIYWQRLNTLNQAYFVLSNYNPLGSGSMPTPIEWRIPNTNYNMKYDPGFASELLLNNTGWTSLNPSEKRIMFQNLDRFFKYCLQQYDQYYNL